ncbi:unnamed protein product [Cylindrotheca closterium]|uniref:C2HC zinc finger plants domain-containing protein n=1 Tax=Cylindrotheca closterium TaxID=2856 RepID=A0AAD2CJD8_9STRA|nr:unnamed protein product [Cylindrotheca closterium]
MGNEASASTSNSAYPFSSTHNEYNADTDTDTDKIAFTGDRKNQQSRSEEISSLIHFAESNYESRPNESLSALMEAMTLNSGPARATHAMKCIKVELERPENLGNAIHTDLFTKQHSSNDHRVSVQSMEPDKHQRIAQIVQNLLADRSTYLYQMGHQNILQQAMEDGSSVVCRHCNGMIPAKRWYQHQQYWCQVTANNLHTEIGESDDDVMCCNDE